MTYGKVWCPILGICALHLTHPSAHTHTHTHTHTPMSSGQPYCCGAQGEVGGSVLTQGSQISRGIEGGRERWLVTPPPTIPAGPEIRTRNLHVTSPTLYPLGHDCPKTLNPIFLSLRSHPTHPNSSPCLCDPSDFSYKVDFQACRCTWALQPTGYNAFSTFLCLQFFIPLIPPWSPPPERKKER